MPSIAVVINKNARNATLAQEYLEGLLQAGLQYSLYQVNPENLNSVLEHCSNHYSTILIGGGDGSVRAAAQYCATNSLTMGVLPLGTLNHFAKEMALPLTVDDLVDCIKNTSTTCIDLATVNGQIFVNNSSIGFYPKFAIKRMQYSRRLNKWLSYIPGFIESLKKHKEFFVTIKSKELNVSLRTSFLMLSNNLYTYEFPATFKRASFQEGILGLYYFKYGKIRLMKIMKYLLKKKLFVIHQSPCRIEVHFKHEEEVTVSLDGETSRIKTPLYYDIMPRSLTLLTRDVSCK